MAADSFLIGGVSRMSATRSGKANGWQRSEWSTIVRHEHANLARGSVRNCLTDEGRPLEVGLQERASNRLPAAVDKSHGRERGRKRSSEDWVRCQARRGLQGNHD